MVCYAIWCWVFCISDMKKDEMCGKRIKYIKSHPFSALHWEGASQHSCALNSSSRPKSSGYFFGTNLDIRATWNACGRKHLTFSKFSGQPVSSLGLPFNRRGLPESKTTFAHRARAKHSLCILQCQSICHIKCSCWQNGTMEKQNDTGSFKLLRIIPDNIYDFFYPPTPSHTHINIRLE